MSPRFVLICELAMMSLPFPLALPLMEKVLMQANCGGMFVFVADRTLFIIARLCVPMCSSFSCIAHSFVVPNGLMCPCAESLMSLSAEYSSILFAVMLPFEQAKLVLMLNVV